MLFASTLNAATAPTGTVCEVGCTAMVGGSGTNSISERTSAVFENRTSSIIPSHGSSPVLPVAAPILKGEVVVLSEAQFSDVGRLSVVMTCASFVVRFFMRADTCTPPLTKAHV